MLDDNPLWYKDAVIYEVHVRSFYDSIGDGMGDFRGLTQKLDYLEDLGVTAIWLLPFYPSPLKDDGYDIADYTDIHPHYGQLSEFEEFLEAAHRRGLRVINELVLNHTSDEHPWFQRARHAPPGSLERDFYVWSDTPDRYKDARIIFKDFERSNWTWDPVAKAYYWHRFYSHQPDLNYDNPAVREAILPIVDFWLGMGVDGMRLDAIPYLYEREGTGCENLPEGHEFLRALRAHVDARYPNRMLLAEANQWPEDAVAYLGSGDECHMAFHFPVMPRMFMALHMEDRFPILDILAQTPAIPENCQWCLFLRNHDELTLEMVTDEERDYMYRAYAQDPQARINLGIRHRLAPLLHNDRRRIELMKGLLFSMPGTPVLYYGDEIGMGDNIYLGDRNAVRTPMQWSSDRNAGFSRANPQKLYLPVIIDPEYHFEAINVEAQQNNPSSLLWWTKRLIALRKQHKAFGRGSLEFLRPENPKILVFLRRYHDETILVVANLSRFVQYVEVDLREFQGKVLEELIGRSTFPPIGDLPYLFTLGPHAFYWFEVTAARPGQRGHVGPRTAQALPVLTVATDWNELFENAQCDRLEELLPEYLQRRRANGTAVKSARIEDAFAVRYDDSSARLTLVRVETEAELPETELVPLTFRPEDAQGHLLEPESLAGLAQVRGGQTGLLCDAFADPAFCRAILRAIIHSRSYRIGDGDLAAVPFPRLAEFIDPQEELPPPALHRAELGNPSVVFGDRLILKVFGQIEEGVNPGLEVGRFLTEHKRFEGAIPVIGAIEHRRRRGEPMTLALLHPYVPNHGTAWQLVLDQLSTYFEQVVALPRERQLQPPAPPPLLGPADGPPTVDLSDLLGPFATTARLLGQRTAQMHLALAAEKVDPRFAPEAFTPLYRRSLYQSMRNLTGRTCALLRLHLPHLAEPLQHQGQRILDHYETLLRRFRGVVERPIDGWRIRCHGNYHLGHLLNTGGDFVVIDFEGDPERSISERRIKRSPLQDVARMALSLHHAAHSALYGLGTSRGRSPGLVRAEDRPVLEPWAPWWFGAVAREFTSAYCETVEPARLLPDDLEAKKILLDVFLLEKALETLGQELSRGHERALVPLLAVMPFVEGGH